MAFFDFLRKKKEELDEPALPTGPAHKFSTDIAARHDASAIMPEPNQTPAVQMEILRTQLDNMRMQYESINARLQNIERLVTEIRGFWK
jgi:hypothetical protein